MAKSNIYDEETGLINRHRFFQTSPNVLLFSLFRKNSNSAQKVRHYFAKIFWKKLPDYSFRPKIRIFAHFFIWPYFWAKYAKQNVGKKPYFAVKKKTGKSVSRQVMEQFYLAFFYSVSIKEYYMYELFRPDKLKDASKYLMRLTFKPLIFRFMDEVYMKTNQLDQLYNQDSKNHFDRICKKYKLNSVPVYAHIQNKETNFLVDRQYIVQEEVDLFIKPEQSRGGHGAEIWKKTNRHYVNTKGEEFTFENILKFYAQKKVTYFSSSDYIIQPRLKNHKEIDFGAKALSTIRINTLLIDGEVYILFAVFRFSSNKTSNVDNFHAGGLVAAIVNLETGELGSASKMEINNPGQRLETHPLNGHQVKGLCIPYWPEAKKMVKQAHKIGFQERALIGWDVAITDQEPILIESNGWPDSELIQTGYNQPIADFAGFDLFAEKLKKNFNYLYS